MPETPTTPLSPPPLYHPAPVEPLPAPPANPSKLPIFAAIAHGFFCLVMGLERAATEIYTRVLERSPNDANVRSRLEWLRNRQ